MKHIGGAKLTVRVLGMAVAIAMLFGAMPAGTFASQERGGGSYSSPTYDFQIEWDDSLWSAEETAGTEGVEFNSDLSYGFVQAIPDYSNGAESCVADSTANIEGKENVAEFVKAPKRIERPASGVDLGELFTYVNTDSGAEIAIFIECRDLAAGDAVLQIMLLGYLDDYEAAAPTWEDLLLAVETGSESNSNKDEGSNSGKIGKGESASAEIDGNAYINPEFGFTATWDEDAWTAEPLSGEDDVSSGFAVASEYSYGMIIVEELQGDFEDCAVNYAEQIGSWEAFTKFRKASNSFDLPRSADESVGALYTYVDNTNPDKPAKVVAYFECRLLPEAVNSNNDDADAELDSVTTPRFEVEMSFDPEVWEVENLSDDETDNVSLISDFGRFTLMALEYDADIESCVETLVDNEQDYALDDVVVADRVLERPELGDDAEGELYSYTFDSEDGPLDVMVYLECRQIVEGESVTGIAIFTSVETWNDALPVYQTVLDSIEVA